MANFLDQRINFERVHRIPYGDRVMKLGRMETLYTALGKPTDGLPIFHLAGTKGKGSTAAMLARCLTAAGWKTGLYSSPHILNIEERIQINGQPIPHEAFEELLEQVRPVVEKIDAELPDGEGPTFFDILTATALLYFEQQQVEYVVLETGLGGRLDSTNVVSPLVSILTHISFDHTTQLGSSLAQIATEKAGIIKPHSLVVSDAQQSEVNEVIREKAAKENATLLRLDEDFSYEYSSNEVTLHLQTTDLLPHTFELGMRGEHQAANATLAVAAMVAGLGKWGHLPETDVLLQSIQQGLREATLPCRFEIFQKKDAPTVVLDGAHNVASVQKLLATLEETFGEKERTLIFAASRDKHSAEMLEALRPHFASVLLTEFVDPPKSEPAANFLTEPSDPAVEVALPAAKALEQALQRASAENILCVTGSLFLTSELRRVLLSDADQYGGYVPVR